MEKFYPEDLDPKDPLLVDDEGLYITLAQMQFWLNRRQGTKLFRTGSHKFLKYYNSCRTYNLISDMLEEDPECASLYWDDKLGVPVYMFPASGTVASKFSDLGLIDPEIEEK